MTVASSEMYILVEKGVVSFQLKQPIRIQVICCKDCQYLKHCLDIIIEVKFRKVNLTQEFESDLNFN